MRARITRTHAGFYVGEVYGTWENWLLGTKWTGWDSVTSKCWTKWGAKLELEKWKKEHCPDEFEL